MQFFVQILFGSICAYLAKGRGRNPVIWFLLGMFLGVFGVILLFLLPVVKNIRPVSFGMPRNSDSTTIETTATEIQSPNVNAEDITIVQMKEWFYLDKNRNQIGPVPFAELKTQWQKGEVTSTTYVWAGGMSAWQYVKDIPELLKALW